MFSNVIEKYNLHKKIIIYLRKSREEMTAGGYGGVEYTLERHEEILQTWAINNLGGKIPDFNIYREVGSGETITDRPVMQAVLEIIKSNEISGVLVIEPQRLSRGELKDCGELIETLEHSGTVVLTPPKIYDLSDKFDKKIFRDELLRGNEYLEYTKEILARGRHLSVSQGKFVGSVAPYGYDKEKLVNEKGFKLVPNNDAPTVKLIFSMFIDGATPYKIAEHLRLIGAGKRTTKEWEHGAVKQVLLNPVYYGYQTWESRKTTKIFKDGVIKTVRVKNNDVKLYKGLHDPLVSENDFNLAQEIIKNRSVPRTVSSLETQNALVGIVKCKSCGRSMARQVHTGEFIKKRKHEFNKAAFQEFIKYHKKLNKITHKEIYSQLGIPSHYVYDWFSKPNKFYPAEVFINNWAALKNILKITTNKFDAPLCDFVNVPKPDTLACINPLCKTTSSHLHLVEDELLQVIAQRLSGYKNYLDNYEMERIQEIEGNKKLIQNIDEKMAALQSELKTALRNYNRGDYSREEYLGLKNDINGELEELKHKKAALSVNSTDKIIYIKKSIPMLEKCINNYSTLSPQNKNKILKSILSVAYYSKRGKGTDFEITPEFKI